MIKDLLHFNIDNIKGDIDCVTKIFNEYMDAKNEKKNELIRNHAQ